MTKPWNGTIIHVRVGPRDFTGNYDPAVIVVPDGPSFTLRRTRRRRPASGTSHY